MPAHKGVQNTIKVMPNNRMSGSYIRYDIKDRLKKMWVIEIRSIYIQECNVLLQNSPSHDKITSISVPFSKQMLKRNVLAY